MVSMKIINSLIHVMVSVKIKNKNSQINLPFMSPWQQINLSDLDKNHVKWKGLVVSKHILNKTGILSISTFLIQANCNVAVIATDGH